MFRIDPALVSLVAFCFVGGATFLATKLRSRLPEPHLSSDTKDTVKLAMGLVATMTALVLGLLVAAAKGSYDSQRNAIISSAARLVVLDQALVHYGPETSQVRAALREATLETIARLWPKEKSRLVNLAPDPAEGSRIFSEIEALKPQTDAQREIKSRTEASCIEIIQTRWLLCAQSGTSISIPLLIVVVFWLAILFFSFGLFAPPNHTALVALIISALSVSGAIFLILELDQPFDGLIHIPDTALRIALQHMEK